MRTWRWLGVNEGEISTDLMMRTPIKGRMYVKPGQNESMSHVCRKSDREISQVAVGENSRYKVTSVVLAPDDGEWAGVMKIRVDAGGSVQVNVIYLGGRKTSAPLRSSL